MSFTSNLKGNITEALLQTLLEDADYRVLPMGIEKLVREVKILNIETYNTLGLSPQLRLLPDYLIINKTMTRNWFVEVKFRKCWDESVRDRLYNRLLEQVKIWSPMYLVVFLSNPAPHDVPTTTKYIRMCRLVYEDDELMIKFPDSKKGIAWKECKWTNFSKIQSFFNLSSGMDCQTIKTVSSLLPHIDFE